MLTKWVPFIGLLSLLLAATIAGCIGQGQAAEQLLISRAKELLKKDPVSANLLLLEIRRLDEIPGGLAVLDDALGTRIDLPNSQSDIQRTGAALAELIGHSSKINDASFSVDGLRIVTASDDKKAIVWNAESGKAVRTLPDHEGVVFSASFSPDGKRVLTASGRTAAIWDVQNGKNIRYLSGHDDLVVGASYSRNGRWVLTASNDRTARIWDAETGEELHVFNRHRDAVTRALLDRERTQVLTVSRDTARLWDIAADEEIASEYSYWNDIKANTAMFDPADRSRLVTGFDFDARIWGAGPRSSFIDFRGHKKLIEAAAFSNDGELLVTASADETARVWKIGAGRSIVLAGHEGAVKSVAFSPSNRRWVATASNDGSIRLWDSNSGQEAAKFTGNGGPVSALKFNTQGDKILTISADHVARLWLWTDPSKLGAYLKSRIRARIPYCLAESERNELLGVNAITAEFRQRTCETCLKGFFEDLGAAQPEQWKVYLEAWSNYESCTRSRG
jgi:WD40 repeat protein